jgi:hypothetical protein
MIFASFIGIFVIPPLYVMFQAMREKLRPSARPREIAPPSVEPPTDAEAPQDGEPLARPTAQ